MQHNIFYSLVITVLSIQSVEAQPFDKLAELKTNSVVVYHSAGHEQRTTAIASRVDNAVTYLHQLLGFKPVVTLLVLTAQDWSSYTTCPVYGMPHYDESRKLLIVAAEDNELWKSFLSSLEQLPPALREEIKKVQVLRKLWDSLKSQKEILTDAQLISFLEINADKSVADVVRYWDRDTIK